MDLCDGEQKVRGLHTGRCHVEGLANGTGFHRVSRVSQDSTGFRATPLVQAPQIAFLGNKSQYFVHFLTFLKKIALGKQGRRDLTRYISVETAISAAVSRISATIYSLDFRLRSRTVHRGHNFMIVSQIGNLFAVIVRELGFHRVSRVSQDSTGFHRIPQGSERRGGHRRAVCVLRRRLL